MIASTPDPPVSPPNAVTDCSPVTYRRHSSVNASARRRSKLSRGAAEGARSGCSVRHMASAIPAIACSTNAPDTESSFANRWNMPSGSFQVRSDRNADKNACSDASPPGSRAARSERAAFANSSGDNALAIPNNSDESSTATGAGTSTAAPSLAALSPAAVLLSLAVSLHEAATASAFVNELMTSTWAGVIAPQPTASPTGPSAAIDCAVSAARRASRADKDVFCASHAANDRAPSRRHRPRSCTDTNNLARNTSTRPCNTEHAASAARTSSSARVSTTRPTSSVTCSTTAVNIREPYRTHVPYATSIYLKCRDVVIGRCGVVRPRGDRAGRGAPRYRRSGKCGALCSWRSHRRNRRRRVDLDVGRGLLDLGGLLTDQRQRLDCDADIATETGPRPRIAPRRRPVARHDRDVRSPDPPHLQSTRTRHPPGSSRATAQRWIEAWRMRR